MTIKSAAELIAITKGKTKIQIAEHKQRKASAAAIHKGRIDYFLGQMHTAMEKAPEWAANGIGWISVYDIGGDYVDEGSLDDMKDRSGQHSWPGFEEAWQRLQAELAPLGYRFARTVSRLSTGSYDTPYEDRTYFVVEWAAPWVVSGRR